MKKISVIFTSFAIVAMAFVGCEQVEEQVAPSSKNITLNFVAEAVDPTASKATLTPASGETAFAAAWEKDKDLIAVFTTEEENLQGSYNGSAFAVTLDAAKYTEETDLFIGYYPYVHEGDIDFGSDRTQNGSIYNSMYDVMATDEPVEAPVSADATITLPMHRQTAIAYFHLKGSPDEGETIQKATLTVDAEEASPALIAGAFTYDDSDIVGVGDSNSIAITFEEGTNPSAADFSLWFNVLPVSYKNLKLEVETENYTLTINNPNAGSYAAGKLYKVSAEVPSIMWVANTKYIASFSINGVVDAANNQELTAGAVVSFPEVAAPDGKAFVGWAKEAIVGAQTNAPEMVVVGEEIMGSGNVTYFAVFANTCAGIATSKYGFEDGDSEANWNINGPVKNDAYKNTGSYSGKINTNNTYVTFEKKAIVKEFSFYFTRTSTNNNYNVYIETSVNNTNWNAVKTFAMNSFNSDGTFTKVSYTFEDNAECYVRFRCYNTTAVRYVDDIEISYYDESVVEYSEYFTSYATLTSIAVSGTPAKTTYIEGEEFELAGLVATGTYSDNSTKDITDDVQWTIVPSGTLSVGTTSVSVKATCGVVESAAYQVNITVNADPGLNTMDLIFAAATKAQNTATPAKVTFNNWVVSGVKNNNAYVTDGTKGFIIYSSGHGFVTGDILSGTVNCNVQLYNGASELTNLTKETEGLTVTKGGTITPASISIAELSGVNTGAVITFESLRYNGSTFSDGSNTIKPYNGIITLPSLTSGRDYQVTGVYVQYNTTKEIAPRTTDDFVLIETPYLNASANKTTGISASGETITITVDTNVDDWNVKSDNAAFVVGAKSGNTVPVVVSENTSTTDGRTAHITVSATGVNDVVITLTQAKKTSAAAKQYTATITIDNIDKIGTGSGYSLYNGNHTVTATAADGSTKEMTFTSSQVMPGTGENAGKMQFQAKAGTISGTEWGNIASINAPEALAVSYENGDFTVSKTTSIAGYYDSITIVFSAD